MARATYYIKEQTTWRDTEDDEEGDNLYELKETITETLAGLEYEILNNGEF